MNAPMTFDKIQEQIGYRFGDLRLLRQSMMHVSYGHEFNNDKSLALRDNERLEFLGDAVLDLVISDLLLEAFPDAPEGQLSKMRAAVVNEKTLFEIGKTLRLSELILLGKGEQRTGGNHKPSIVSSAFEALIAAIYIDGGFNAVYPVVRFLFAPIFKEENHVISFKDYKTKLQEKVQAFYKLTPTYHQISSRGPDHAKIFEVEVKAADRTLAVADGPSKKEAEQNAARAALEILDGPDSGERSNP
jgi:ribonuclease III